MRAHLHERFAQWLEQTAVDLAEFDEIAGWHLEQVVRYRRELGQAVNPAIMRRGAEHLLEAGQRARDRSDLAAATNLLERALVLASEGDTLHARISVELAEQLVVTGDLPRADELLSVGDQHPDTAARAALTRLEYSYRARPHEATQIVESRLPRLLEQLARTGDERGLAKAHLVAYSVH
jgi:hypothetical protein